MEEYWNPMVPELSVSNFEASLSFYVDVLGFSVRIKRENPDFVYLEQEQVQIMLEQITDSGWITGELVTPLGRGVNFQIELSDLEPLVERLKKANVRFFRDLKETWYDIGEKLSGEREFLIQDLDGYLLRFTQHLGEKAKLSE
ncbi:bleomycin resistance protein [Vibrio splendidus]|uniref:bleomycin resistance protein n=1 Tax=Vibrio splendidus TaxID=29497 RepID=UPI000D36E011|nr:VOC family protein [Vibrio splendidus]MDH5897406.1 VOC family protein [Vibrio splendidus]MDH5902267.1 VOC family protein [Vibrio splendidus]MDH5912524.1 VOC family protein [Vibrio splendidus]MDH5940011.1 VOC family protein [Vibrio splendidus]MDH5984223.1 VOC family protein [Vibrio splendidus]